MDGTYTNADVVDQNMEPEGVVETNQVAQGDATKPAKGYSPQQQEAIDLYNQGLTVLQIAAKLEKHPQSIRTRLERAGVLQRSGGQGGGAGSTGGNRGGGGSASGYRGLTPQQIEVIELRKQGKTPAEIVAILGKHPQSIRTRMERAAQTLKQHPEIAEQLGINPDELIPPRVPRQSGNRGGGQGERTLQTVAIEEEVPTAEAETNAAASDAEWWGNEEEGEGENEE